jgi:hypothetical protein
MHPHESVDAPHHQAVSPRRAEIDKLINLIRVHFDFESIKNDNQALLQNNRVQ